MVNRVQAAVLAVFAAYWLTIVGVMVADRPLFDLAMRQLGASLVHTVHGSQALADGIAVALLTMLLGFLSAGVVRGWRWTFWLILVAFLFNVVRVPVAALQLLGLSSRQGPEWIVVLEVVVGLVQLLVAGTLVLGYRKAGVWGS